LYRAAENTVPVNYLLLFAQQPSPLTDLRLCCKAGKFGSARPVLKYREQNLQAEKNRNGRVPYGFSGRIRALPVLPFSFSAKSATSDTGNKGESRAWLPPPGDRIPGLPKEAAC